MSNAGSRLVLSMLLAAVLSACESQEDANLRQGVDAWADVVDMRPDPAVVGDSGLSERLTKCKLPWRVRDRRSDIELVLVPPGTYTRGGLDSRPANRGPDAHDLGYPRHRVAISRPFYIGRFELTHYQWVRAEMDTLDKPDNRLPRTEVSFDDVARWLSSSGGLRLPTEAEWEYACREAGTSEGHWYGELERIAWYGGKGGSYPRCVGTKQCNKLGIYDMIGNVSEYCSDWYSEDEYSRWSAGVTDPAGPLTGVARVIRGGSFASRATSCSASVRDAELPQMASDTIGFRVVRDP